MTLIEDILVVARATQESYETGEARGAAERVLAAHNNGGLPRAILGQMAQVLESRLVTALRQIGYELTRGD